MDSHAIAKEWFAIAESDLASADFLQDMQPVPVEIICYHCQQAAEKFLKGFLALKGEEIKRTHNLPLLNMECQKHDTDFETVAAECLLLTDYGVTVRYPFPLEINESDMKSAIASAYKVKEFVLLKASTDENTQSSNSHV